MHETSGHLRETKHASICTKGVSEVVLQKSIAKQIRQLILYASDGKG
jgi:hypothetical protein